MKRLWFLAVAILMFTAGAFAQEHERITPLKSSPEFERLKKLVGKWEGSGGGYPATAEFRMTGGGSAIMQILGAGSPYEMVTMFTMDGDRLLATHYCAAHNQPRMALAPSKDANSMEFKFVDGANIQPGFVHMDNLKVTVADADHHTEVWTSTQDGKSDSETFEFHRVK